MYLQKINKRLLKYNLWANKRLITFLASLNPDLLYTFTGSSFGTIDKTIQHILSAERYWHAVIFEGTSPDFNRPERENVIEEVMSDLIESSKQLINDLQNYTEDQLTETIAASDSTQSRFEYIVHLVNHASYHRGQVVTMCRALNVTGEIPVTDYDAYLWWIENMPE